jgi:hypothetical protein
MRRLRLLLALGGLLVGLRLGDPGLLGHLGGVGGGQVLDIAGRVDDLADLERVHDEPEPAHLVA